ncbi:MAG: hypothetical protein FWD43_00775 [Coriobacteriia bacterium]|nr:hypothetical protein [Coriobacteriia bacterium]
MSQTNMPLKITQSTCDDGKIQLNVTVPKALIAQMRMNAALMLAMTNYIAIEDVFEHGGEAVISRVIDNLSEAEYEGFLNHLALHVFAAHAVTQQKLEIIMEPQANSSENVEKDKDYHFITVVTPKPVYELSSYDPVTVKIPSVEVSDAEIDEQLYLVAEDNAKMVEDEGAEVRDNSRVVFAIESQNVDGPIKYLTSERKGYQLGDNFLPEEFDTNIIGMKIGEARTFDFDLPGFGKSDADEADDADDADDPDAADNPDKKSVITTTVTIKEILKKVIPAITDAWVAENIPDAQDVVGLREMIREEGVAYKTEHIEEIKLFAVASELAMRIQGDIPDELYEYTRDELMANIRQQLQQNNMQFEDYLAQQGLDEQSFSMQLVFRTGVTLRQRLALDALARHMKLKLTDDDIEAALENMAPGHKEELRQQLESNGRMYQLTETAMRQKANKWLYDTASYEVVN